MLLKPKKSLGQNFLHDKNIISKIIDASKICSNDEVLEIGPGTGNLTNFIISQKPKKIYVIEKDENLANGLEKKFHNQIKVIKKGGTNKYWANERKQEYEQLQISHAAILEANVG